VQQRARPFAADRDVRQDGYSLPYTLRCSPTMRRILDLLTLWSQAPQTSLGWIPSCGRFWAGAPRRLGWLRRGKASWSEKHFV